jgi:hypothetical protein
VSVVTLRNGVARSAPAADTTRTLPAFSSTNSRPSGANAWAVGVSKPLTHTLSWNPAGSVVAIRTRDSRVSTGRRAAPDSRRRRVRAVSTAIIVPCNNLNITIFPSELPNEQQRRSGLLSGQDRDVPPSRPGCD